MDAPIRKRLDAALLVLVANFLLLLIVAFQFNPPATIGVLVLSSLVGIGLLGSD